MANKLYDLKSLIDMQKEFKETKELILISIASGKTPDDILTGGVLPLVMMVEELIDQCVIAGKEVSKLKSINNAHYTRITNN